MATPRTPANQRQRTWRPQTIQPEQLAKRRRVFRVVLPLAGLALLMFMAWLMYTWFNRPAELKLIAIAVADYRNPEAPPIPYCYEDIESLRKVVDPGAAQNSALWNDANSDGIAQLATALRESAAPRENLLVYIKAHGVSLNEGAYLLGVDFELRGTTGRMPVEDLLRDVAESPAALKLLVLDTGHLESDPRMGMLTNEFTHLLTKAVAEMPAESNVWVLTSNSLFERAHVSLKDRRSALSYYLTEGLLGAADGILADKDEDRAEDKLVQLDELYQYLRDHVMQYARSTSFNKQGQTPLLLRSGEGVATEIPATFLARAVPVEDRSAQKVASRSRPTRAADGSLTAAAGMTALALVANQAADATPATTKDVAPQPTSDKASPGDAQAKEDPSASKGQADDSPKAAPAAAKDDASKSTSDTKAPEKGAKAPDDAQKQPATAKEQPKTAPTDAAPKPPAKKLSAVEKSVLDYFSWLENQQNNADFWRPVDYAPDLARAYYESLCGCRQRVLAGHLFLNVPDYQAALQRMLSEIRTLQGKIDERRLSFRQGQARQSYERDPDVRIAIRTRNDACHLLPLLVAHHWLLSANTAPTMQRDLQGLTSATLDLDHLLSQPADPQQADSIQAFESWKREVGTREIQVRDHIAKLKDDFQKRIVEQKRFVAAANNQAVARCLAELAQSPFATAAVRDELQSLAETSARSFTEVEAGGPASLQRPPISEQQRLSRAGWERAVDRARLELELLAFVLGAGNDARLAPHRKTLDSAMDQTTPDSQLQLARDVGEVLFESYRDVPVKLGKDLESIRYAAWRSAETAIRLADARDQSRVEKELTKRASRRWSDPIAGVPLEAVPKLERSYQLAIGDSPSSSSAAPIALDFETPRPFRLRFQSQNTSLAERVRLKLTYDDARVDVRGPQRTDLKPGAIWEFPTAAAPGGTVTEHAIELALASHDQRGQQTNLTLTWLDGNDSELAQASAVLVHPEPAFAQLAVFGQRETANHNWRENNQGEWFFDVPFPDGIGRVSLLTFSGHETRYDFRLTNGATHAKKYKAVIYAIPAPDEAGGQSRSEATLIMAAEQGRKVLATSELSLGPGSTATVPFFSTQPPAPTDASAAAKAAATDAAKGAEASAKEPPPDVTSGMVCILEETTPVTTVDAAKPRRQVVVIEVEMLPPPRYLTPLVNFDASRGEIAAVLAVPSPDRLPINGSKVEIEVITREQIPQPPSAKRATTLTRQDSEDTLRAFVKRGTTDRAKVYLHVDGYPRAFIYELALDASLPNVERKSFELREITLPEPSTFRIYYPEKVDQPVPFPFAVDMPPSAARMYLARLFIDRQPGGDFDRRQDEVVFESYEDRDRHVVLLKPTAGPGMAVASQLSDPKVSLELSPYPGNQRVHVRAQLVRKESDGVEVVLQGADQELVLYLDGGAPTVIPEGLKGAVYENEPFSVAVRARDEVTGIKRVEYSPKVQKNPENKAFDEMVLVEPKELRLSPRSDPLVPLPIANVRVSHTFEKAGEQSLWFQATDESGNKSELAELPVTVRKIQPAAGNAAAKAPGNAPNRLEGRVVFTPDGARGQFGKVILTGPANRQIKPSDDGSFVFDKLPPGDYEVKAEGIVNNSQGKSEPVKVTVEPAPKKMDPITVPLSR